ncbi:MAG TPA: ABC transporter substrate-binding protein, partial [Chloroflexota bacterium]
MRRFSWIALVLAVGCGAPAATQTGQAPSQDNPQASRTFVFIARSEPTSLGRSGGVGIDTSPRFFNATLMMRDGSGTAQPELAEKLPQLNTDSWRLLPDGRMETIYRLKPNVVWHDGEPFTADDLVFTWQVHRDLKYGPTVGAPGAPPDSLMDQATAPDPLTFVVQWRQLYPKAGELSEDFRPLPRHSLEAQYQQVSPEDWDNLPFWTRSYVGLGAYRVDQWEPGTFVEGAAFDRFLFGRPKIERLRLIFMQDPNAVAATLLAEAAHLVA